MWERAIERSCHRHTIDCLPQTLCPPLRQEKISSFNISRQTRHSTSDVWNSAEIWLAFRFALRAALSSSSSFASNSRAASSGLRPSVLVVWLVERSMSE